MAPKILSRHFYPLKPGTSSIIIDDGDDRSKLFQSSIISDDGNDRSKLVQSVNDCYPPGNKMMVEVMELGDPDTDMKLDGMVDYVDDVYNEDEITYFKDLEDRPQHHTPLEKVFPPDRKIRVLIDGEFRVVTYEKMLEMDEVIQSVGFEYCPSEKFTAEDFVKLMHVVHLKQVKDGKHLVNKYTKTVLG